MDGDPCKFVLTSRVTNSSIESFVLHSSHLGVRQVWTLQISQILESQRNFLNGTRTLINPLRNSFQNSPFWNVVVCDVAKINTAKINILFNICPSLSHSLSSSDLPYRVPEDPCRG